MNAARAGELAPDFELPGTGNRKYRLSDYRGRPVMLVFYPGDNTPVCTIQLRGYSDDLTSFDRLGVQVLGLSPQDVDSHEAFAEQESIAFPLLADVDRTVASAYGVLGPLGFYRRSIFVIDSQGNIGYAHRATAGMNFKSGPELVRAIEGVISAA